MSSLAPISSAPGKGTVPSSPGAGGPGLGATRLVLAGLSGIACLAALQALALPRWPAAAPLAAPAVLASLGQAGLGVTALSSSPGQRSNELARGPRLAFLLRDGATTATLELVPAQVRQRANFQLALISRDQPSLALPPGLPLRGDGGSLAYVEGPIGQQQLRQTCLVSLPKGGVPGPGSKGALEAPSPTNASAMPAPIGGVSAAQLGAAADRGASGPQLTLSRILGLTPNRNFGCLLVSLGTADPSSAAGIDRLWRKVLPSLAKTWASSG